MGDNNDPIADAEEQEHWINVQRTLLLYDDFWSIELDRRQRHLNRLPTHYANRLPAITFDKFEALEEAIQRNQGFLREIARFYNQSDFSSDTNNHMPEKYAGKKIPYSEQRRNEAILHCAYREWSGDPAAVRERRESFQPLIEELKLRMPINTTDTTPYRVLVPGCGLARLPIEIAALGYSCEANEFSAFMVSQ